jgi:hypothetical protein
VVTDHGVLYVQKVIDEETMSTPERNAPCPCGSGKKYKQCCGRADRVTPDVAYIRVRRMEGEASEAIQRIADRTYGKEGMLAALAEFNPEATEVFDEDDPELKFFFWWYQYNWLPEAGEPPAEIFLKTNDSRIDPDILRLVETTIDSPYSFLQVTRVRSGEGFDAHDIMRGHDFAIVDRSASQTLEPGNILYGKVVQWKGLSVMMGSGSRIIPAAFMPSLVDLRTELLSLEPSSDETLTDENLLDLEDDLREAYFDIVDNVMRRPPDIRTTDGDPLLFHTIRYEVPSFEHAFDALKGLDPGASDEKLLMAGMDESGQSGEAALIHWSKRKKGGDRDDTVVQAVIRIRGTELVLEANSEKRAAKVRREVEKRLGKEAVYLRTEVDSIEGAMKKQGEGSDGEDAQKQAEEQERLMALPEVQAKLKEMMDKHWATWPDAPVPALRGLTPRQAAKDPRGRELLESLLLDFESRNRHAPGGIDRVDVTKLRRELGMMRR